MSWTKTNKTSTGTNAVIYNTEEAMEAAVQEGKLSKGQVLIQGGGIYIWNGSQAVQVDNTGYLKAEDEEHVDLTGYAKISDLPDVSNFITLADVPQPDLTPYATKTGTETLTNKTLSSPTISTINNNNATLTLPTTTGTIALTSDIPSAPDLSGYATKTGTETLTNKTLSAPTLSTNTLTTSSGYTITFPNTANATVATTADVSSVTAKASTKKLTNANFDGTIQFFYLPFTHHLSFFISDLLF